MKHSYKKKSKAYLLGAAIMSFLVFSVFIYVMLHPTLTVAENAQNAAYTYSFYINSDPAIENHVFYGNQEAGITLIGFTDLNSEASNYFIQNIFPLLEKDYIHNNTIKFYHKPYITLADIRERNENFEAAMSLGCIKTIRKEEYYAVYFEMAKNRSARKLLEKYNIPVDSYNKCMYGSEALDALHMDALEIEGLGIVGMNQRFYIGIAGKDNTILDGVQPYDEFQQAIRQHGIEIGN